MIGLCTDSNAQLPSELVERYGVEVVPIPVTVDGREYQEGVDLDADGFWSLMAGARPAVSSAAPAPGRFVRAYRALVGRGATEILSVHIGSAVSGTLNSARVGAGSAGVPVRLVDTGHASFTIACALWEAAEQVAGGADLETAATVAEGVARRCGNVFVVGALDLARAGGRLDEHAADGDAIPVMSMVGGRMTPVGSARSTDEAADVMAANILSRGPDLRVGVGVADAAGAPLRQALEARLAGRPEVKEVVLYRIGPSVGVHTGPGTAGATFYPAG